MITNMVAELPGGGVSVERLAPGLVALRKRGHSAASIAAHAGLDRGEVRRIMIGERRWVRPATAARIVAAVRVLATRPPSPLATVESRRAAVDAVDHSGRSAAQVARLVGVSQRTVKRFRAARRAGELEVAA